MPLLLTVRQFAVHDLRLICLLLPMRRDCTVASDSVSYFSLYGATQICH